MNAPSRSTVLKAQIQEFEAVLPPNWRSTSAGDDFATQIQRESWSNHLSDLQEELKATIQKEARREMWREMWRPALNIGIAGALIAALVFLMKPETRHLLLTITMALAIFANSAVHLTEVYRKIKVGKPSINLGMPKGSAAAHEELPEDESRSKRPA